MNSMRNHGTRLLAHIAGLTLIVGVLGLASLGAQGATDDPAQLEAGMAIFETNCAGCHGADGTGSSAGRPLIGIADQEPDRLVHIASVTDGKGTMPAWGDVLEPDEIDSVVSYLRLTFVADSADAELAVTGRTTSSLITIAAFALVAGFGAILIARRREASNV